MARKSSSKSFFGMRPNWVLSHPEMRGNPYMQSIYTHLRGMPPYSRWKSERELARVVADETGFSESVCRKTVTTLKKHMFISISDSGQVDFGSEEVVTEVATTGYVGSHTGSVRSQIGYTGSQSGSVGSQNGYTGSHDSHTGQGLQPSIDIETNNREVEISTPNGVETPNAGIQEAHMILGSDPEEVRDIKTKIPNQPVQVFDYFNFVARTSGAAPITTTNDRVAFLAQVKRAIKRGVSVETHKRMIDAFFQFDRNREHRAPWKLFVSAQVHRSLLSNLENISVSLTDSVMNWIANDFQRTDPLPWDESFDKFFQSLVHRTGMSVAYRYPDLLSSIAKRSSGSTDLATDLLVCAATLIDKHLNDTDTDAVQLKKTLADAGIELPNDLKPKRIRKEANTLKEAVLTATRLN